MDSYRCDFFSIPRLTEIEHAAIFQHHYKVTLNAGGNLNGLLRQIASHAVLKQPVICRYSFRLVRKLDLSSRRESIVV